MKFVLLKFLQISCFITIILPSHAFAMMEDYPSIKLQGLDKSVGRTVTFEAKVGSTIQYGPLFVKIHSCRKAPPIEKPESAAFLQIWEVPPGQKESEWVFSGWMFASSPALSAMDHPVYDVWVLDCTGKEEPIAEPEAPTETTNETVLEPKNATSLFDQVEIVDSEAEDQTPLSSQDNLATEKPVEPSSQTNPEDEGFTAYDLMKQSNPENSPYKTTP